VPCACIYFLTGNVSVQLVKRSISQPKAHCDKSSRLPLFQDPNHGEEETTIEGDSIVVRPGSSSILNDDQPYSCASVSKANRPGFLVST